MTNFSKLSIAALIAAASSTASAASPTKYACLSVDKNSICSMGPNGEGSCHDLDTVNVKYENPNCYNSTKKEQCNEGYIKIATKEALDCNPPIGL